MKHTVRKLRRNIEMSQKTLADKLGVTRQVIIKIEKNDPAYNEKIPLGMAFKVTEIFNKPFEEIFLP